MIHELGLLLERLLAFLSERPLFATLLVITVQILVIAITSELVSRRWLRDQVIPMHRLWLFAVVIVLGLLPTHFFFGGWPIAVRVPQGIGVPVAIVEQLRADESSTAASAGASSSLTTEVLSTVPQTAQSTNIESVATEGGGVLERNDANGSVERVWIQNAAEQTENRETVTPIENRRWNAAMVVGVIYCVGLLLGLLRIGYSLWWLQTRRGHAPSSSLSTRVRRVSDSMRLCRIPDVRIVDDLSVPLVAGLLRPRILLPRQFETWTETEQSAALWHELMHVLRRDTIGQWLTNVTRSLFWFHPAIWFVCRRVVESREWATDRQVIECSGKVAGGLSAEQYAESLLNIVERIATEPSRLPMRSGIAMSAGRDLEGRLQRMLGVDASRPQRTATLTTGSLLALVFATAVTTVTIERTFAKPTEPQETIDSSHTSLTETNKKAEVLTVDPILPGDNDLIHRIMHCPVHEVEGDAYATIVTVHGQVVDADGTPIAGATVVLRESGNRRASVEPDKYKWAKDRHRICTRDVFAKTTTDQDGRFRFDDVKSPAYPPEAIWSSYWDAGLLATHPAIGVGYFDLPRSRETSVDHQEITIRLRSSNTISGRVVTPEGTPLFGATVRLQSLDQPSRYQSQTDGSWELWMSQLTPIVETKSDGLFQLEGLPEGYAATVSVDHPDWVTTRVVIATSDDVRTGQSDQNGGRLRQATIIASPAEVVADPGIEVSGRVFDPEGMPIADAQVLSNSHSERIDTDSDGKFSTRVPTELIARLRQDGKSTTSFRIDRKGFLGHTEEVTLDDVEAQSLLTISLQPGVRVQGRVVDEVGEPVPGMVVWTIGRSTSGITDSDGAYEIYLSRENYVLAVGTLNPAFELPGIAELTRAKTENDYKDWPHVKFDLSDGMAQELPPLVVSRRKPISVVASLPDGSPAVGATMVVKDEEPVDPAVFGRDDMPPFITTKSDQVTSDELGRAELQLQRGVTDAAVIEVRLATDRNAFVAIHSVKDFVDGNLHVQMKPATLLEGRVLVDGDTAAHAEVGINEVTPLSQVVEPDFTMMVKSNHLQTVTDEDGWYRIAVQTGLKCDARVRRVGDELIPNSGRSTSVVADGERVRVPDIALQRGNRTIAGVVQDLSGNPIEGVTVHMNQRNTDSSLWIGHEQHSQFETDSSGRFRLANVPEGTYELWVRSGGGPGQPSNLTSVQAEAGDENMVVVLSTGQPKSMPRLEPLRIDSISPLEQ